MVKLLITLGAIIVLLVILGRSSRTGTRISLYTVLIIYAGLVIVPFYMMLVWSTLSSGEIFSWPPKIFFGNYLGKNFQTMQSMANMLRAFLNSCLVSISYVSLSLFFCSIGGFSFAVYKFPFKKQLFTILILTMMIPWTAGIVPWFVMMSKFGWLNTYYPLIIPHAANAFGIFWMRQYCTRNVPISLLDAARIDGCSEWFIFPRIVAPIILPAYATLGIMQFVNTWNDFIAPMMMLRRRALHTLPIALSQMITDRNQDYGVLLLASAVSVLPLLVAFLLASKYFLSGLTAGAIKE